MSLLQRVVGVEFLSQLAHGPVVIHPWSYGCLAKALNQTSKGTNSKIRWKYMGKIEFGLDLVQVSSFVFGCINIPGTVPDAVALAASTGILLERSIQTSAPNREKVTESIFHLPCRWWEFSWPSYFPVIFVPIYLVLMFPASCQEMTLCAFRRESFASLEINEKEYFK